MSPPSARTGVPGGARTRPRPGCGFRGRRSAFEVLFRGAVPDVLFERRRMALFGEVLWAEHSRALTHDWDGEGADPALADAAALHEIWRGEIAGRRCSYSRRGCAGTAAEEP